MFNLTKYAIENSRITFTALGLILVMGLMGFFSIPRAEDPGFIVRKARIVTYFPGASPERMENLVTDKLEKVIQEMPELEYISSESRTGVSLIIVKIEDRYKDIQKIWDKMRRKVARASDKLPKEIIGPIVNDEFGDVFGTIIAINAEGYSYSELKEVADEVRDKMLYLPEVAKVDIYGAQEERIFIEYDESKLSKMGASSLKMRDILEGRNIVTPGGAVITETERIYVEPSGNFETIEELENAVVAVPGNNQVTYLKDLATITRGYVDPPTSKMHFNGKNTLAVAISLREGGNITKLGDEVNELVGDLRQSYPIGVNFETIVFQPDEVANRVNTFVMNLAQSVTIVMVIMLFSLGLRSGLIVGGLIPMTIMMSFAFMYFFGIGIDQISVAALIIALGMLVDNAIVMCESIMREINHGKEAKQAAIDCAHELSGSLLTSSLTTSAAFLPIFLAKSMAGEYTSSLFTVVTIALLSSWVLSLTMIPVLCVHFLHYTMKGPSKLSIFYIWYRNQLIRMLKKPWQQIGIFAGIFVIALVGLQFVSKSFFPTSERPLFTLNFNLPVGVKIEVTEEVMSSVEDFIEQELMEDPATGKEGVINFTTFVGGATPRYVLNYNPDRLYPEQAFMMVNTSSPLIFSDLLERIENYVHTHHPEVTVSMKPTEFGPPVTAPVAIRISGEDKEQLFALANSVKSKLRETSGVKNIRDDWGESTKKLIAKINQPRALRAGLTNRDIALSLQTIFSGFETTQFREDGDIIPVSILSSISDRQDLDRLETFNVVSQSRGDVSVPLKQVADLELVWQPNSIKRRNRMKTVTVQADLEKGYNPQKIAKALGKQIDKELVGWPKGYQYELGGEIERSQNSSQSIREQVPIALLIIVLLLIVQFNSFRLMAIIFLTIPMGIIGVSGGLLLTGTSMGFMTFLGVVSLSGIVINDAIVLLERIKTEKDFGRSHQEAILEAAIKRFRPIVLTTNTTVGGMLPLWLCGGALFKPMAVAIIFGLIFATFLTLGFVPVLYALLFKVDFTNYKKQQLSV